MGQVKLNYIWSLMTILAVISSFLHHDAYAEDIKWPLPRLSEKEKQERIDLFLSTQDFVLQESSTLDQNECKSVSSALMSHQGHVIAPYKSVNSFEAVKEELDLKHCENLPIDKVFYPHKSGMLNGPDKEFSALPLSEKIDRSLYYYEAKGDFDLYDFSSLTGKPIRGASFEYSKIFCKKDNEICKLLERQKFGPAGWPVIDKDDCKELIPKYIKGGGRLRTQKNLPSSEYTYKEDADVSFFYELNGSIYRVALVASSVEELRESRNSAYFFIEKFYPLDPDEKSGTCSFDSRNIVYQ